MKSFTGVARSRFRISPWQRRRCRAVLTHLDSVHTLITVVFRHTLGSPVYRSQSDTTSRQKIKVVNSPVQLTLYVIRFPLSLTNFSGAQSCPMLRGSTIIVTNNLIELILQEIIIFSRYIYLNLFQGPIFLHTVPWSTWQDLFFFSRETENVRMIRIWNTIEQYYIFLSLLTYLSDSSTFF